MIPTYTVSIPTAALGTCRLISVLAATKTIPVYIQGLLRPDFFLVLSMTRLKIKAAKKAPAKPITIMARANPASSPAFLPQKKPGHTSHVRTSCSSIHAPV